MMFREHPEGLSRCSIPMFGCSASDASAAPLCRVADRNLDFEFFDQPFRGKSVNRASHTCAVEPCRVASLGVAGPFSLGVETVERQEERGIVGLVLLLLSFGLVIFPRFLLRID